MHVTLKRCYSRLLLLTGENKNTTVLKFPTGDIKFIDIKAVQPELYDEESTILVEPGAIFYNLNWMDDSVLAGFLFKISNYENQGIISYTPAEVKIFFEVEEVEEKASRTMKNTSNEDHNNLFPSTQILFPYHINGNHWILIILKPKKREIIGKYYSHDFPLECFSVSSTKIVLLII